ncbi:hypothetical protein BD309DRAFT_916230 [Dichomitus squalens]|uniref:Uncharacterized protein n=2 Tax=Dichomitus squalens TaxID=114155 RepID=A0A4Q9NWU7_9APHY|nr:hypothetical protein BD309DRAFT_916230 [Dichomitus squalens]TBU56204.1 hypothetical protein BD310DRAFT_960353 [Dichomitus squalens]
MPEIASSPPSTIERYYTLKGRPHAHLQGITLPPEVECYLGALTEIAEALGIDDLSFSSYASAIDDFELEELSVSRALLRTRHVEDDLTDKLLSTIHEDQLIQKWMRTLQAPADPQETVPAMERRKAALTAKAKEYARELDELNTDMPENSPLTITELAAFRKELKKQEQVLKEKRAQVEAFQGLPPNIELARLALQEARDKQMELIQLRERLLGKMVDGVS